MHMAKKSASSWLTPARSSSTFENRAPTPVRLITPTMIPAQAQTAMIWIDITPASSSARSMPLRPRPISVPPASSRIEI